MADELAWTPYWLSLNDELPHLGSGIRHVLMVDAGKKWVRIKRVQDTQAKRIPRRKWDAINKVLNTGQSLSEAVTELRPPKGGRPSTCRIG